MNYWFGLFLLTISFALYVQFGPDMGNVWIRSDSQGFRQLVLYNLGALMLGPFRNCYFWKPSIWLINYPLLVGIYSGGFYYFSQ